MSASTSSVVEAFEDLGIDLAEPKVVDLLASLCDIYRVDVDELSTEVMSYMYSRKMGATATPDLAVLADFERDVLKRLEERKRENAARGIVDVTNIDLNAVSGGGNEEDEDALLSAYGGGKGATPNRSKRQKGGGDGTPEGNAARKKLLATDAGGVPFSPASFKSASQNNTPNSRKYQSRPNSGSVVIKYGDATSVPEWKTPDKSAFAPTIRFEEGSLRRGYRYMFEPLQTKAGKLDEVICRMGEHLRLGNGSEEEEEEPVDFCRPSTDPVVCLGRVCSDSADGKINAQSIMLQGSQDICDGKCVSFQPSRVGEYSLFPGQIVKALAANPKGTQLLATKIAADAAPPLPAKPDKVTSSPLSVLAAAGPYTTSDNLSYEPLADLLRYVRTNRPHLAVLVGPFVDERHDLIASGQAEEAFEDTFKRVLAMVAETARETPNTNFLLVSSMRDVHHHAVYPTPPFEDPDKMLPENVTLGADPCCFAAEGVVFGVAAADVLFHLGREEISAPPRSGDRLRRLSNHLLQQRSFYPLFPPSEDMNVDFEKLEAHAQINTQPHVLILPSDFLHFFKDINGGLVLNPSRLAKREAGGTFARFLIHPRQSENQPFAKRIVGEIVRV